MGLSRIKGISLSLFSSVLLVACYNPKNIVISKTNSHSIDFKITDSTLLSIQQTHDLVIGYARENTAWSRGAYYYFIALKGKQWTAIKYQKKDILRVGESPTALITHAVPKAIGDSLLGVVIKNNSWTIRDSAMSIEKECLCSISDGWDYYFNMMTRSGINSVKFYEPGYYHECCPEWNPRTRYLITTGFIYSFFKRNGYL